jgi:hypothetical protein
MISSDQRSPKISSDMLTGQPERGADLVLSPTREKIAKLTCKMQVIFFES